MGGRTWTTPTAGERCKVTARTVIGWRVVRSPRRALLVELGTALEYATGAGTWTPDLRRAFLFTTYGLPGHARGLNDGLRWAREHRRHLEGRDDNHRWKLKIRRVSAVRRRTYENRGGAVTQIGAKKP